MKHKKGHENCAALYCLSAFVFLCAVIWAVAGVALMALPCAAVGGFILGVIAEWHAQLRSPSITIAGCEFQSNADKAK